MSLVNRICADPSHRTTVRNISQETLYKQISKRVADHLKAGTDCKTVFS